MKISNSLDYTEWFEALLINLMQLLVNMTLFQSSFLLDAISRGLLSVLAYTERLCQASGISKGRDFTS